MRRFIGKVSNPIRTLVQTAATQAEQETGTAVDKFVSPGRQQFHPSAAKCWIEFTIAGVVNASYNITSVDDTGLGDWTVNIATDMSSGNYSAGASADPTGVVAAYNVTIAVISKLAGSFRIIGTRGNDGTILTDPFSGPVNAWAFGDQ